MITAAASLDNVAELLMGSQAETSLLSVIHRVVEMPESAERTEVLTSCCRALQALLKADLELGGVLAISNEIASFEVEGGISGVSLLCRVADSGPADSSLTLLALRLLEGVCKDQDDFADFSGEVCSQLCVRMLSQECEVGEVSEAASVLLLHSLCVAERVHDIASGGLTDEMLEDLSHACTEDEFEVIAPTFTRTLAALQSSNDGVARMLKFSSQDSKGNVLTAEKKRSIQALRKIFRQFESEDPEQAMASLSLLSNLANDRNLLFLQNLFFLFKFLNYLLM
jgi:hypothetical protein